MLPGNHPPIVQSSQSTSTNATEQTDGDSASSILEVVNCILRASNSDGDLADQALLAELLPKLLQLGELASLDSVSAAIGLEKSIELCSDGISAELDSNSLGGLLAKLAAVGQSTPQFRFIREAAHFAIGYRDLRQQFANSLQANKTQAIYNFAYGLSHELNNPLANIASRAGLLQQMIAGNKACEQLVQAVIDNAMRGGEMLGDLMLIARPPAPNLQQVDLQSFADQVISDASRWSSQRNVRCEFEGNVTGSCRTDPVMLQELLWCLLRNAIEVSADGDLVRLIMRLEPTALLIVIQDSGPGLSDTALKNCFDPYYSGREAGRGLGMGLAKARRFAMLLGGNVEIRNRVERGCEAIVCISIGEAETR